MKTPKCPFTQKKCMEHECMLYTHVQMVDPQTGKDRDEWACSLALIPLMIVEGARCTRGVQSAVESARNEIVQRQDILNALAQGANSETRTVGHSGSPPRLSDYGDDAGDLDEGESLGGDGPGP